MLISVQIYHNYNWQIHKPFNCFQLIKTTCFADLIWHNYCARILIIFVSEFALINDIKYHAEHPWIFFTLKWLYYSISMRSVVSK